ncbi:MAG TPA: hypothetical protein VGL86_27995, partial [Polyangia bacterium]|jgi:hypothetical protein
MRGIALGLLLAGCAAPATEMRPCPNGDCEAGAVADKLRDDPFMKRVSFDLGCPATGITVVEFSSSSRGVSGCGRRATYAQRFPYSPLDDSWVLDTPVAAIPDASAPAKQP